MQETFGVVAQLGERLNGIQEVRGSIPLSSTNLKNMYSGASSAVFLLKVSSCTSMYTAVLLIKKQRYLHHSPYFYKILIRCFFWCSLGEYLLRRACPSGALTTLRTRNCNACFAHLSVARALTISD